MSLISVSDDLRRQVTQLQRDEQDSFKVSPVSSFQVSSVNKFSQFQETRRVSKPSENQKRYGMYK